MKFNNEGVSDLIKKIKEKRQKDRDKKFWKQHYSSIKLEGEGMDIRNLKALALVNVLISELTGPAKKQLIRYIKEADEVQLMSFLMDSEIVALDESAAEIVEDRFAQFVENHYDDLMEAPLALSDYMQEAPMRIVKGIKRGIDKEREIKKSNMTPEQKKRAWYNHLRKLCREDAKAKNWSPEQLKKCYAGAKRSAGL